LATLPVVLSDWSFIAEHCTTLPSQVGGISQATLQVAHICIAVLMFMIAATFIPIVSYFLDLRLPPNSREQFYQPVADSKFVRFRPAFFPTLTTHSVSTFLSRHWRAIASFYPFTGSISEEEGAQPIAGSLPLRSVTVLRLIVLKPPFSQNPATHTFLRSEAPTSRMTSS
jgi:hypothetical protein